MRFSFNREIDKDKLYSCKNPTCNWSGVGSDLLQQYVHSSPESWMALAGREGYEYRCPVCRWIVDSYYWRMS